MSEVYKTVPGYLYFASFSVVNCYDVFIRREFVYFRRTYSQKQDRQLWQYDNHPFKLYSNKMIDQKVEYIHNNPVDADFTDNHKTW